MRNKAKATTDSERIRHLEKENAKLREERDILRKAAKYSAEETRWLSASSLSIPPKLPAQVPS